MVVLQRVGNGGASESRDDGASESRNGGNSECQKCNTSECQRCMIPECRQNENNSSVRIARVLIRVKQNWTGDRDDKYSFA